MKNRRYIIALTAVLLSLHCTVEVKAQNLSQDTTDLTEITQMLTSRYWISMYYHNTQPELVICGQLLEFKTNGEAVWHGIFKETEADNMSELISFIDKEEFRKMKNIPKKYELSWSFERCNRKCVVNFQENGTRYTIGFLSDNSLVFLEKNRPPFIMISIDKLACPDFVKEHLNYIQKEGETMRIRGVFEE